MKESPIEIDKLPSGLPTGITTVLMRCLEKDPKSRQSSFSRKYDKAWLT